MVVHTTYSNTSNNQTQRNASACRKWDLVSNKIMVLRILQQLEYKNKYDTRKTKEGNTNTGYTFNVFIYLRDMASINSITPPWEPITNVGWPQKS